jgi:hypothetical protein
MCPVTQPLSRNACSFRKNLQRTTDIRELLQISACAKNEGDAKFGTVVLDLVGSLICWIGASRSVGRMMLGWLVSGLVGGLVG